jgi:curved DNA-binding protein CbpA
VAPAASLDEIRAAYRARARRLHPDVVGGDTSEMAELNEAWAVLSDPARRAEYDTGLWRSMAAQHAADVTYDEPPVDLAVTTDDSGWTLEEGRAARGLGCLLALTTVLVTVALVALFVYAFTRSGHLRP